MAKKSLDEQLKELEDMIKSWETRDGHEDIIRGQFLRKVQDIRKYSEGVIKI